MELSRLNITRKLYGANEGKMVGEISFISDGGTIELILSPEACSKILAVCAEDLVEMAKETANNLTAEIIEQDSPKLTDESRIN